MAKPFVVLQTDFSLSTAAVSTMHGVIYQLDPSLRVEDLSHEVIKFDPYSASINLAYALPYWPKGTIFVSVVDPGVGTNRKASVARLKNGSYIVTPDNGSLTHPDLEIGIEEIREISEAHRYPGNENVNIFHGRDLFAWCAGKLAAGIISYSEVGASYPLSEIVRIALPAVAIKPGKVSGYLSEANRNFGIFSTNITTADLADAGINMRDEVLITVTSQGQKKLERKARYEKSFGYVPVGELVIYPADHGGIGLGLNQGNLIAEYDLRVGVDEVIEIKKI
ncbi:MAG: SAM-dependent chlorinase/fluorinase [Erysipelotrichaceae bacterium]|nr:SAM-dependent chlorinase/fluorinase [Erysipelotrichaceae bacterium]